MKAEALACSIHPPCSQLEVALGYVLTSGASRRIADLSIDTNAAVCRCNAEAKTHCYDAVKFSLSSRVLLVLAADTNLMCGLQLCSEP